MLKDCKNHTVWPSSKWYDLDMISNLLAQSYLILCFVYLLAFISFSFYLFNALTAQKQKRSLSLHLYLKNKVSKDLCDLFRCYQTMERIADQLCMRINTKYYILHLWHSVWNTQFMCNSIKLTDHSETIIFVYLL